MSYRFNGLGLDLTLGASATAQKCIDTAKSGGTSTADAKQYGRCAADVFCAAYKVPPDLCESVAGPVVDAVVDVWNDVFGGTYTDCSKGSQVMCNGVPCDPCSPCGVSWYIAQYGPGTGPTKAAALCKDAKAAVAASAVCRALVWSPWDPKTATQIDLFDQMMTKLAHALNMETLGEDSSVDAYHQEVTFRGRVASSVPAINKPEPLVGDAPHYFVNPSACTATNGGANAIAYMISQAPVIKGTMVKEYQQKHMKLVLVKGGIAPKQTPIWPWVLGAAGVAAAGYVAWKKLG